MPRKAFKLSPFQLAAFLSIGLIFKSKPVIAQEENFVGYRHEFYQEDDHRMSIDTDTAEFLVGLGAHLQLSGLLVRDAISGATPTGAPPETQWPFPTFKSYYNQYYNQLFRSAINNPNNLILYQSGYFPTFQAYTNYVAKNNPQLGTEATNAAAASRKLLTSNPNFHNTSVPLTQLHDLRNAFSFGAPVTINVGRCVDLITPQVSYSTESDYYSLGLALNNEVQFNQKNTALDLGWAHNSDLVRDDTLVHWQSKDTDSILIGLNQLMDPKSYLSVDFTYSAEHGYLSDPYRGVMAMNNFLQTNPQDGALIPENRPRFKGSEVLYANYTRFIDAANGSADLGCRFYHDDYSIYANTLESSWHQKLGGNLVISPSFRYYVQSAASFYYVLVPDFDNLPAYYSSDYRLSEFESFNLGIAISYRVIKHLSLDASYARYIMRGLDGVTSQSAYPSANIFSIGARVWF